MIPAETAKIELPLEYSFKTIFVGKLREWLLKRRYLSLILAAIFITVGQDLLVTSDTARSVLYEIGICLFYLLCLTCLSVISKLLISRYQSIRPPYISVRAIFTADFIQLLYLDGKTPRAETVAWPAVTMINEGRDLVFLRIPMKKPHWLTLSQTKHSEEIAVLLSWQRNSRQS